MRKTFLVLAGVTVTLLAGTASAQFGDPGDLGIFFNPAPTRFEDSRLINVMPFRPFDFFVLSLSVPGGMEAYEFAIMMPAGAIVSVGRILPAGATDFGVGEDNWIVGTGGICQGTSGWFTLVQYAGVLFLGAVGNDVDLCLFGSTPSSFPSSMPGYLICDSPGILRYFGAAYAGCAVLNCTDYNCRPYAVEASSFGALKASF